jgi:hypothetical protein
VPPKRIEVSRITCIRDTDIEKKAAGFQVSGFKGSKPQEEPKKVGFILSGVKIISFQQLVTKGIRLRVKWIPNGFEIREELHQMDEALGGVTRQNNIIFVNKEDNFPVIMQGEPQVHENTFTGQLVRISWFENIIEISAFQKKSSFQCVLNSRNNRVDCIVK